jgi:hypothetical protein
LSRWQPIATAPKDGTPILIYVPDHGWTQPILMASWSSDERHPQHNCWEIWCGSGRYSGDIKPEHPTHWMPLPERP